MLYIKLNSHHGGSGIMVPKYISGTGQKNIWKSREMG